LIIEHVPRWRGALLRGAVRVTKAVLIIIEIACDAWEHPYPNSPPREVDLVRHPLLIADASLVI
jgi:hypothetical protein